jgi:hypothetical protein
VPLPTHGAVVPLAGRWITLTEEVGAAISSAMAPGAMAVRLTEMLADANEAGDADVRTEAVGDTEALNEGGAPGGLPGGGGVDPGGQAPTSRSSPSCRRCPTSPSRRA